MANRIKCKLVFEGVLTCKVCDKVYAGDLDKCRKQLVFHGIIRHPIYLIKNLLLNLRRTDNEK